MRTEGIGSMNDAGFCSVTTPAVACSAGVIKDNRVLLNMGYSKEESREALRMSFSPLMTMQEKSQFI